MKTNENSLPLIYGFLIIAVAILAPDFTMAQQENATPQKQNEPKVQINVNRELDENGNVVRYDSTYSWSWSSTDTAGMGTQFQFKQSFGNNPFGDEFFSDSFIPGFNDSLLTDPFMQQFEQNFSNMDKIMEEQMKMFDEMQKMMFGDPSEAIPQEEKKEEPVQKKGISL
jgi:hypothetical protein